MTAHSNLARTPFGKSIPARDCSPAGPYAEAIARISRCGWRPSRS